MQKTVLFDKTGDIDADFHIITYSPIQRGVKIEVIEALTQPTTKGIKLYVERFDYPDKGSEPLQGDAKVIYGKIKTHLAAAFVIKYGTETDKQGWLVEDFIDSERMETIIREIMR